MTRRKLQLPKDFAQRILDNEIEYKLAEVPSNEVICSLLVLYSQGIEYYESIKSHKFLYFKRKMEEIFHNDKRLFVEHKQEEPESPIKKKMNSKNEAERIEALKFKEKQQKIEQQIIQRTNKRVTRRQAQQLIREVDQKQKLLNNKIKGTLDDQNSLLQQKLLVRKKKSFSKSFSAYGFTEGTETKESLFTNEPNSNEKATFQPLLVSFQDVIQEDESDEEEDGQKKRTMMPRGKMVSMGMLF